MALCAITDFNCHCQCLEALIRHPGAKATAIPVVVLLPLPLMLLPGIFPRRVKKKKKLLVGPIGSIYPHNKNKQHENRKTVSNIPNDSGRATGDDIDRRKQNSEHLNIEKKRLIADLDSTDHHPLMLPKSATPREINRQKEGLLLTPGLEQKKSQPTSSQASRTKRSYAQNENKFMG